MNRTAIFQDNLKWFILSQSYHGYQYIYDRFFSFLTKNLNMPKIYHSRDAQEMFTYSLFPIYFI